MRAGRFLFSLLKVLCIASGLQGGDDKGPRLGEFRQPWPFSFSVGAPLGGQAAAQENAAPGVVEHLRVLALFSAHDGGENLKAPMPANRL